LTAIVLKPVSDPSVGATAAADIIRRMSASIVVQKYGGSSLADADRIRHVARRVHRDRRTGVALVVVVSAMGDTTDHLLALAARITDDPDPREMDLLLATGEHMSGTLVAMALHSLGVPAISLTGAQAGIRTDTTHGRARIANIDPARVQAELAAGKVVIVAGFQGTTDASHLTGEVTTLGRGGSDTTAVALAAQLKADRCEIFTDVEGIFTADPRLVPDARLMPTIGYEEMLELALQGAQVMQPRAVELGWVNRVEIAVRSTFSEHPGTRIKEDPRMEQRNKVRGLATDRNVAKLTLVSVPDVPGIARRVFTPLADAGIRVDMIVQNVSHSGSTDMSFTVDRADLAKAKRLLEPVVREMDARELTTDSAIAKVSIVGAGIHNSPGYAARMFGALADEGVNIEMISTSEIRITCIIAEDDLERAARALHAAFQLEQPEEVVERPIGASTTH
jgi:aspartate kinase